MIDDDWTIYKNVRKPAHKIHTGLRRPERPTFAGKQEGRRGYPVEVMVGR
jgi:hypothetical protein